MRTKLFAAFGLIVLASIPLACSGSAPTTRSASPTADGANVTAGAESTPTATPLALDRTMPASTPGNRPSPGETTAELRSRALTVRSVDIGIPSTTGVWGVVMDTTLDNGGWFTAVSFADGTASLYLSTGGGVIGGGFHDDVKAAAVEAAETATLLIEHFSPTTPLAPPAAGTIRLYVKTGDRLLVSKEASQTDLAERRDALSDLFYAMHGVIAALRNQADMS